MKRCPTCNRTFEEDWLAFCTQDGTTLIEESLPKSDEPPPTIMAPAPPPPSGGWKPPSSGSGYQPIPPPVPPSNLGQPSGGLGSGQFQPPRQMQPGGWQPPPPPAYATKQQQGLAIASLVCGLFSVTIGWCYIALVSGPVAVALGIAALMQVKKNPDQYGGKPLAIAGIVTGAVPFVVLVLIIMLAVLAQIAK